MIDPHHDGDDATTCCVTVGSNGACAEWTSQAKTRLSGCPADLHGNRTQADMVTKAVTTCPWSTCVLWVTVRLLSQVVDSSRDANTLADCCVHAGQIIRG